MQVLYQQNVQLTCKLDASDSEYIRNLPVRFEKEECGSGASGRLYATTQGACSCNLLCSAASGCS